MIASKKRSFGEWVRDRRLSAGLSLRRFAQLVGVSPTYMSQVEQGNFAPPTADRARQMAAILKENADELIALAGRIPEDLPTIIRRQPTRMPELLREASGLTAEQLQQLTAQARMLKREGSRDA